ncbi:MAG: ParA family protein [Thermodesulfovibrio sp.]|uniref:ParA family protein n=1 Tax=unclassified Thermodesulfovibrio TaxID=2645936 RepID=UPI00083A3284|nr:MULTISPECIES: ParA family protein [unclassified Thermodesulfovibrio]MDI1472370.1 ParA family protein [Thermodesulfovibrio sp. 1176]MDI6714235.1 ParA family protein [Thermodesulfovibrio sp.]ODA43951.1 Chromosome (plasmid) partitioning protein ParA [Thermodesulfovibrio sp. N1]
MATVISITNRKGGTGKSTTTVNLSAEFAIRGKRTLVIDMDTQAHATLGLGFSPNKNSQKVHSLFLEPEFILSKALFQTKWENLFIMPANPLFEHGRVSNNKLLKEGLKSAGIIEEFDFILIDTPPSLDSLLLNALVASDYVLVPFLPHFLSTEGIRSLARIFFKIATTENPSLKLLGLVPVMINQRIQQHRKVTENVSNQFGRNKVFSGIRTDIKLVEAFENHTPVKFYSPYSRGAVDYEILAEEVLREIHRRNSILLT